MRKDTPNLLYKYRHLVGEHRKWTKDIITDSKVYFSKYSQFNDPFDCQLPKNYLIIDTEEKGELVKGYCEIVLRNEGSGENCQQIEKRTQEKYEEEENNPERRRLRMQKAIDTCGFFCLSEEPDNILLWSHYANAHKGLCLEFSLSGETRKSIREITYTDIRRPQDGILKLENSEKIYQDMFFTKGKRWAYEKEWRVVNTTGSRLLNFGNGNGGTLEGIIFGCEMPEKDKKEIEELVSKRNEELVSKRNAKYNSKITLEQAEIAPDKYALKIVPYKP